MKNFLILVVLLTTSTTALAQYEISVAVDAGGFSDAFTLFPNISVLENVSPSEAFEQFEPTDAFVTFENGPGFSSTFSGFVNHPDFTSGRSSNFSTTEQILQASNTTWKVTIEDDGNAFEYDVDVELVLPFAELPHFESSTLVNDGTVGTFDWTLEGGSADFPGPSSSIRAFFSTIDFHEIDRADLPIDATAWTPMGDLNSAEQFRVQISTRLEAIDTSAFGVTGIRALTSGAPELTFRSTTIQYTATRSVIVNAVPEPSSGFIALTMLMGVGVRRRRSC